MILGKEFVELDSVPSTQDIAKSSDDVACVFAWDQTVGRGRFDRRWESQRGDSLTASFVCGPVLDPAEAWLYGMTVAIIVAEHLRVGLQWPNDLVAGRKKCGGVLSELSDQRVICGVGVNLNQSAMPDEIAHRATSLWLETGIQWHPLDTAKSILEKIVSEPQPSTWAAVRQRWDLLDKTAGKRYKSMVGVEGTATGVDDDGRLVLQTPSGEHRILAGEALFPPNG